MAMAAQVGFILWQSLESVVQLCDVYCEPINKVIKCG
jgi:hypothetical protein